MIKSVLVINDHGKPRLTRFYEHTSAERQQELIASLFTLMSKRSASSGNIIENEEIFGKNVKIVYRAFATLYFAMVVDEAESELAILDLIHVFVDALNKCYRSICELDILFNFPKIHQILNEIIIGGQVVELNSDEVARIFLELER